MKITRRVALSSAAALALPLFNVFPKTGSGRTSLGIIQAEIHPSFPSQAPERVQQFVGASHGRIETVRTMLMESPALAKASIDWGFGDWESALGAASHVGNREIATLLMEYGARPDLFTFAMLGQLDVVKAYVEATPGIQKIRGPHGFTLMHHAKQGGRDSEAVVAYLERVGDADIRAASLPLTDDEKQRFVGSFISKDDDSIRFDFAISRMGPISIKREPYGSARNLNYLGNNEFSPVGGDAVRIRFNAGLSECTIVDGPLSVLLSRE